MSTNKLFENLPLAKENLKIFCEAARDAVKLAKLEDPQARGMAGIGYKFLDGSGKLVANFDSEPFCDDLELLLNYLDFISETT